MAGRRVGSGGRRGRGRHEDGQAAVELALVVPLLLALLVVLAHVGLLVRDRVLVVHAAREAARAVAVDPQAEVARRAARATKGLDPRRLEVTTRREGPTMTVVISYRAVTNVRFLGRKLPEISVNEQVTALVEN
jgi:Flp pilus assembly protein TadG